MPLTNLCDREKLDVAKSQIGFIKFLVVPLFSTLQEVFPQIEEQSENINKNIVKWQSHQY